MNACENGKIWRAIDAYDYVCVDQQRLFDISEDNKLGDSRIAENGCQPPYVPRNAFVGDEVCVTKEESKRIQTENDEQHSHMRYYAFFNGQDTIGI
ncbi:unnamed protein product [Toxocara canis]|uniref:Uncharacterized protein n=1 Tax=Toxocara canis TaxID=6265 RepID=A0A183U383_TOXCA|nr:unnamed protein product [Toxocara canis]